MRAGRIRVDLREPLPPGRGGTRASCSQPSPGSSRGPARSPSTRPSPASPPTPPRWTPSTGSTTCARRCCSSRRSSDSCGRGGGPSSRSAPTRCSPTASSRPPRPSWESSSGRPSSRPCGADEGGPARFLTSLAEAYVRGTEVDWTAAFAEAEPRRVRAAHLRLPARASLDRRRARRRERGARAGARDAGRARAPSTSPSRPRSRRLARSPPGSRPCRSRIAATRCSTRSWRRPRSCSGTAPPTRSIRDRTFKELGFDSPATVELRNRLVAATGLRLCRQPGLRPPDAGAAGRHGAGQGDRSAGGRTRGPQSASHSWTSRSRSSGSAAAIPGGVRSAEDLWRLVAAGEDAIGEFPTDRGWDLDRLVDPEGRRPGTSYVRHGGFLYDAAEFDAEHFSISPREALAMDPQQRLLLECAWEALEDAGIDPLSLRGSLTGVFAGVYGHDYGPRLHEGERGHAGLRADRARRQRRLRSRRLRARARGTGGVGRHRLLVARWSRCTWPCRRCARANARWRWPAGRRVMASPGIFVDFSRQGGLSPDGRCRAFGAGADGTGFSEGVGVLVLEPLSDAAGRRPPRAGRDPRQRDEPGRRLERPDRAHRALAGAGHPPGPGERRARARRRRRRRGARHRHRARRPDRGRRADRGLRPGPRPTGRSGSARSSQHRPRAGGRGRRRA